MSADDLRGSETRADRSDGSDPLDRVLQEGDPVVRRMRTASLLVAAFLLVPLWWLQDDHDDTRAMVEAAIAEYEASPALPLHLNSRVARWINEFSTTRRDEFQGLLDRRGIFEPLIRRKLRERGMPEDLIYLAMMESGYLPRAVSPVSAVGLWQFMGPTAAQYGLRVDDYVDERRDPVRATDAALNYLQWLYDRFGSWYLAAAAYNAGPGRLEHILNVHAEGRRGDEDLYWEVLRHLPRETREYVPRIVAATILASDAVAFGFEAASVEAYEYEIVFVPGETRLSTVAASLDVDVRVVRDLNPHLIRATTPPDELYGVRVPRGRASTVMAYLGGQPRRISAD
jgi:membrane-bound lytic murein transglycosylase D